MPPIWNLVQLHDLRLCAGAAVALSFAESARKILRAEDVAQLKFQSDRKPLNLSSQEGSGEGDRSATGDTK